MTIASVTIMAFPVVVISTPSVMTFPAVVTVLMLMMRLVVVHIMTNRARYPYDMAGTVMAMCPVMTPTYFVKDTKAIVMAPTAK